jgi:hypothetical protein
MRFGSTRESPHDFAHVKLTRNSATLLQTALIWAILLSASCSLRLCGDIPARRSLNAVEAKSYCQNVPIASLLSDNCVVSCGLTFAALFAAAYCLAAHVIAIDFQKLFTRGKDYSTF